ncbi:MAG TPA: AAA family ATPase [Thermoanaerobaculia bacterium]|nr:AAA family ATPase [Thermoanaerobaculia bacterium]
MRLTKISVQNYKSLKAFDFAPEDMTVVVGANAAGKSNFADCIDFISEVYRHGLEVAIGRKGGYENIAFRKMRRSKQPVRVSLIAEFNADEIRYYTRRRKKPASGEVRFEHSFSFIAKGYSIRAEFEVADEEIRISRRTERDWVHLATIRRRDNSFSIDADENQRANDSEFDEQFTVKDLLVFRQHGELVAAKTELLITILGRFLPLYSFARGLEGIRVFQISPTKSREFGVPTPTPELGRTGGNLPAVIDLMQKKHRQQWKLVLQTMRSILPDLSAITVDYTSGRTLGLFFKEEGVGRPWSVDEVSDGTLQTLALLVALFDPESTALVLEEPENSVHPWIIRHIVDACREASARKQIMITTHSPIVINAVRPDQVWVLWRADGESKIARMTEIDREFLPMWEHGEIPTFDYIDAGAVPQALPPAPSESESA